MVSTSLVSAEPQTRLSPAVELWHRPVFIAFLLSWMSNWVAQLLQVELSGPGRWLESLLPLTACATTLLGLARRLPVQNVFMAGFLIGGLSVILTAVAALSSVPFGPLYYTDRLGEKLAGVVPWPMPLAVKVNNYWLWLGRKSVLSWHTAPWVNFLGWFTASLGIMTFTMPWLISKNPVKQPMDYNPLVVWLLLNLLLMTGNALHGLAFPVALSLIGNGLTAIYAIRGARW